MSDACERPCDTKAGSDAGGRHLRARRGAARRRAALAGAPRRDGVEPSGQHTGRTELPLTPAGEEQARALRAMLGELRPALVLSSPRRRARAHRRAGRPDGRRHRRRPRRVGLRRLRGPHLERDPQRAARLVAVDGRRAQRRDRRAGAAHAPTGCWPARPAAWPTGRSCCSHTATSAGCSVARWIGLPVSGRPQLPARHGSAVRARHPVRRPGDRPVEPAPRRRAQPGGCAVTGPELPASLEQADRDPDNDRTAPAATVGLQVPAVVVYVSTLRLIAASAGRPLRADCRRHRGPAARRRRGVLAVAAARAARHDAERGVRAQPRLSAVST